MQQLGHVCAYRHSLNSSHAKHHCSEDLSYIVSVQVWAEQYEGMVAQRDPLNAVPL